MKRRSSLKGQRAVLIVLGTSLALASGLYLLQMFPPSTLPASKRIISSPLPPVWAATGDTLLIFRPQDNEPVASDFATLDTRNLHPVLDFDASTNESAVFSAVMPRSYAGGGLTVYIHYALTSATTGNTDWDVAFERIGDQQQDIDSDGFAAVNSTDNTTVPGTSGNVDIITVTFTDGADMDSIAVGEGFRMKVTRDAASDTATGDAELRFVEIKET